jgi:hypothetical protein
MNIYLHIMYLKLYLGVILMSYYDDYEDQELLEFDHSYCPYCRQNPLQILFPFGSPSISPGQQGPGFGPPFTPPGQQGPGFDPSFTPPGQGGQFSGPPTGPPPSIVPKPKTQGIGVMSVDPGAIRPCRYRYVYLWLRNGRQYWAWLVYVGPRSVAGWRWTGFNWRYFGVDLRQIENFECF